MSTSPRFIGHFQHTLDAKNRLTVPRSFLDAIPEKAEKALFILTLGDRGCLNLFTRKAFAELMDSLDEDWVQTEAYGEWEYNVVAQGEEIVLDTAGRLVISKEHRDWAQIDKEVVVAGLNQRIEIWSLERWQKRVAESLARFQDVKPRLKRRVPNQEKEPTPTAS
ncbi:MAG: hypothetical protein AB1486_09580 [Planctomycetota bacterium]